MADLIPCPSCKKKISVEAQACPKCGQPVTDEARAAGRKKMAEEKRAGRFGCIFFIVATLAIAGWLGKTDTADKAAPTPAPISQPAPAAQVDRQNKEAPQKHTDVSKPSFNLTPNQFIKNFNAATKGIDTKLRAKTAKSSPDVVQLAISNFYAVLLSLDKNGKINGVIGCGAGDGTAHAAADIMMGMAFSIAGVRPNWSPANRGEVIKAFMDKNGKKLKESSVTKDGVKFSLTLSEGAGIIFTIEQEK